MSERSIFLAALEIADPANRTAYLDRACADNAEQRDQVEDLLAAHARSGSFMASPAAGSETQTYEPTAEAPGTRVGPYKLLQEIGAGGMGIVFMAEQEEPIRRIVALKIIRAGMDSKAVLARFEAERQAIALMDHPNIAKVLDAGTTASGRPFFAMELVKGVPITTFCDENQLSLRERLELFVPVCQAIQHAHQKGAIHRDVKPSNVLVAMYDDKSVPKVIDFGVAKATSQRLTEMTLFTTFGSVVGTLEYMSPEQVKLNQLDIDTRSDVYSLGVLLYELLTGSTPLDYARLRSAAFDEVLRMIREEEPQRPSARLSSTLMLRRIAAARHSSPVQLGRKVRGELDWIVMKSLEKDRTRRYETANGLARDVERYLKDDSVEACPPALGYRVRKFVRRNKGRVAVVLSALALLVFGVVGTTIGLLEARRQRDAAVIARHDEARATREAQAQKSQAEASGRRAAAAERQAREETATARAVRNFLQDDLLRGASLVRQAEILRLSGSASLEKTNPTLNELLDRAAAGLASDKIRAKFPDLPLVQAEVLKSVGEAYLGIGECAKAVELLGRAVALYEAAHTGAAPATLAARGLLGIAYIGIGNHAKAVAVLEAVRDDRTRVLGPYHPDTFTTREELGTAYLYGNEPAVAVTFFERLREDARVHLGPDDMHTLIATHHLGLALQRARRLADATRELEAVQGALHALKIRTDHPYFLIATASLARAYQSVQRFAESAPLFETVIDGYEAYFGPKYSEIWDFRHQLGKAYAKLGRKADAIAAFEKNLKSALPDGQDTASMDDLAFAFQADGRWSDALPLFEKGRKLRLERNGPDESWTIREARGLAGAYRSAGRLDESISLLEDSVTRLQKALRPDHPDLLEARRELAHTHGAARHHARSAEEMATVVAARRKLVDPSGTKLADDLHALGRSLANDGRPAEAEPVLRECLVIWTNAEPAGLRTAQCKLSLGTALYKQQKYDAAEPLLISGYQGMAERIQDLSVSDKQQKLPGAAAALVEIYTARNRPDDVKKWQAERAKYSEVAPRTREKS